MDSPPNKKKEPTQHLVQEKHRDRYEAGDARALADSIRTANMFFTSLPGWAILAFNRAYDSGNLRGVFGADRRGVRRDPNRDVLMWRVWDLVQMRGKKSDIVFGEIGVELGMGENAERRVSRLYYEAEKSHKGFTAMFKGGQDSSGN